MNTIIIPIMIMNTAHNIEEEYITHWNNKVYNPWRPAYILGIIIFYNGLKFIPPKKDEVIDCQDNKS
jgi:hypothetical protein